MKLWTIQSAELENLLEKNPVFVSDWKFSPINWKPAYVWMASQMELNHIALSGNAPIWAWHSCGDWHHGPTVAHALSVLTDYQLLNGVLLLELEVPDAYCLLSTCSGFYELIDVVIAEGELVHPEQFIGMFSLPLSLNGDDIQAAIPCIRQDWVMDIRSVDIKPGKSDYEPGQLL